MTFLCNLALSFFYNEKAYWQIQAESLGWNLEVPSQPSPIFQQRSGRISPLVPRVAQWWKRLPQLPPKTPWFLASRVFLRVLECFVTKDNTSKFLFDLEREDGQVLCSSNNSFTFWNFPFLVRSIALFLFDARFVSLPLVSNCGENASKEKK